MFGVSDGHLHGPGVPLRVQPLQQIQQPLLQRLRLLQQLWSGYRTSTWTSWWYIDFTVYK